MSRQRHGAGLADPGAGSDDHDVSTGEVEEGGILFEIEHQVRLVPPAPA